MEADCSYYSASMLPWDGLVVCVQCVRYCGGNGAHIQDTVLVGTALWSVYSVLGTVVGMGPTYRTPCWWGRPCGLCTVCTVYCGGNGAHIQDTVLVGTALWSVYSVYCVLWWEWGPHTGHRAGGDGLVVCVQCVRYCVLWWEWGPHTGHRAGGDGLVVCVQCVLCTVVGMGPTYRTPCWWGRPCGLCTVCTVYCGGNGAHIQDTMLVGTPCGLCTVCTVYCGGNGAHIQDTMLVGTPCGLCTVC